jgi:hypothetical protein
LTFGSAARHAPSAGALTVWNSASPGSRSSTLIRIAMCAVPGIAVISPAKVAERSLWATAVTH